MYCTVYWIYGLNGFACTVHLVCMGVNNAVLLRIPHSFRSVWFPLMMLADYGRFTWHCNKQVLHLGPFLILINF